MACVNLAARVMQLEHTVEMLVQSLAALAFPAETRGRDADPALNLRALETATIERALCATNGCQTEAAKRLGISPRVLSYKLQEQKRHHLSLTGGQS